MENQQNNEIPNDEFILSDVKNMSINDAKRAIDKHFVILSNGDHAMINKGTVTIYDNATLKSLYLNRLSSELKNYYTKEKLDIKTIIFDIHKPFLTHTEINLSNKLKHKYVPYDSFSEEVKKKVDLMVSYMKEVLCADRDDILNHLLKVEARMVRGIKNDCCIYLKGSQGIGKSTHPEFLRMYVMGNGLSIESGSGPLKNRFNSELKGKVMTIFEELENFGSAEWLAISSTLKRWITSPTMQIEGKGKDVIEVINIMTFWLLSNNDAIQDDDGRRYFILPVSSKYVDDYEYFGKIRSQCFNDEVGHAYYCKLMEIDIEGFNSQMYPVTSAKIDSHVKRLDSAYKFIKDAYVLNREGIIKQKVQDIYDMYVLYCNRQHIKSKHKPDFNKALEEIGIKRTKSNSINFYNVTYEQLQKIADKKHWIHDLDEYKDKRDEKSKYFDAKNDNDDEEYNNGVPKQNLSVKPTIDEQIEHYTKLLQTLKNQKNEQVTKDKKQDTDKETKTFFDKVLTNKMIDDSNDEEDEKPIKKPKEKVKDKKKVIIDEDGFIELVDDEDIFNTGKFNKI